MVNISVWFFPHENDGCQWLHVYVFLCLFVFKNTFYLYPWNEFFFLNVWLKVQRLGSGTKYSRLILLSMNVAYKQTVRQIRMQKGYLEKYSGKTFQRLSEDTSWVPRLHEAVYSMSTICYNKVTHGDSIFIFLLKCLHPSISFTGNLKSDNWCFLMMLYSCLLCEIVTKLQSIKITCQGAKPHWKEMVLQVKSLVLWN